MWFECFVCRREGAICDELISHNAISKIIENIVHLTQKSWVLHDGVMKLPKVAKQSFRTFEGVSDCIPFPPVVSAGDRSINLRHDRLMKVPMTIITTVFHTTDKIFVPVSDQDAEGFDGRPIRNHKFMKSIMETQLVSRVIEDTTITHGWKIDSPVDAQSMAIK
jgi:hypothetical protein